MVLSTVSITNSARLRTPLPSWALARKPELAERKREARRLDLGGKRQDGRVTEDVQGKPLLLSGHQGVQAQLREIVEVADIFATQLIAAGALLCPSARG